MFNYYLANVCKGNKNKQKKKQSFTIRQRIGIELFSIEPAVKFNCKVSQRVKGIRSHETTQTERLSFYHSVFQNLKIIKQVLKNDAE